MTKRAISLFQRPLLPVRESFISARAFSITSYKRREESEGFFSKIMHSVEKATDAHSKVLTERDTLYEFECKLYIVENISSLITLTFSLDPLLDFHPHSPENNVVPQK